MRSASICTFFFFFNDTATTEIYTLSLHDALPISRGVGNRADKISEDSLPRPIDAYTSRRIVWIAFSRRRKPPQPPLFGPIADLCDSVPFARQTPRGSRTK